MLLYSAVTQPVSGHCTRMQIRHRWFDADHPMARMNAPDDFVFASRLTLAVGSVAAGLRATLAARAMLNDLDGIAEPVTELGKLHHVWVRERGLPSALDHHDHP
jgi:hypothetical protein